MKLSARNQLKGKVININKGAVNSIVSIDIGGGNIIVATISCAAVEELGLEVRIRRLRSDQGNKRYGRY